MLAYCGHLLSRRDVPARLPTRIFIEAEVIPQVALLGRKPIASAHDRHSSRIEGQIDLAWLLRWLKMTFAMYSPMMVGVTSGLALPTAWVVKCKKCGCTVNCRAIRPTESISIEDTFEQGVLLTETEPMIRRLAEKLWLVSRKETRIPRTIVLKLKTSEFKILTRSYTPGHTSSSCAELTEIALQIRERVRSDPQQRYRLVGVG